MDLTEQSILALLYERSEDAVAAMEADLGPACRRLARNLLGSERDAEECVSDALLAAWNAIPPARPDSLRAWLLRTTRNLAVHRLRYNAAACRDSRYDAALDELSDVLSAPDGVEEALDARALAEEIGRFLDGCDRLSRVCFVRRYWYADPVADIARDLGLRPNAVSVRLHRTREKLRDHLTKEGFLP